MYEITKVFAELRTPFPACWKGMLCTETQELEIVTASEVHLTRGRNSWKYLFATVSIRVNNVFNKDKRTTLHIFCLKRYIVNILVVNLLLV